MENVPSLATDRGNLALSEQTKLQLQTPEDCTQYGKKVVTGQTLLSWHLADLLKYTRDKFGLNMAIEVGHSLGYASTSVRNYIKVSEAFTPQVRLPNLSFSHHFIASTIDEIHPETGQFETDKRFDFLNLALDEGLSVRDLKEKIYENKKMEKNNTEILPCEWCGQKTGEIYTYTFFSSSQFPRRDPDRLEFHTFCYSLLLQSIKEHALN